MLICYPCGPGAGTPTKNIFLKNISKLLDEKIKANEGMLFLPDHLQKINDLEPKAELRQICPLTLLVPTSELQFVRLCPQTETVEDIKLYAETIEKASKDLSWLPGQEELP